MSDKKGNMKDFLASKRKKATKTQPAGSAAAEEAEVQAQQDAEVAQSQDQIQANKKKTGGNEDSSEEEDEDRTLGNYGRIEERKAAAGAKGADDKRAGYGFDDKPDNKKPSAAADGGEAAKQKKTASGDIKFGGPPRKFARGNKGKFGGEFNQGLDDLDEDGTAKKRNKDARQVNESGAGADGGREFVNLGASTRTAGPWDPEEEKKPERAPGVKPTFRGKANLTKTGGGQDEENAGVVTNYGFNVALRGPREEKGEEGKEGGDGLARKEQRRNRDKGQPFGAAEKNDDDDDGFEVVQDENIKRRLLRATNRQNQHDSDSDGEESGRGGFRGGRGARGGRGGFFKNSRRGGAAAETNE